MANGNAAKDANRRTEEKERRRNQFAVGVTVVVALVVLVTVVGLPSWSHDKLKITRDDAIIVAIATGLCLLMTGRISKLVVGKEGFTIETREAFLSSAAKPIEMQVTEVGELPVTEVETMLKAGTAEIPKMIKGGIQGLTLKLGRGGLHYNHSALKGYLESLTGFDFFRYVILVNPNDTLFGIGDARDFLAAVKTPGSNVNFENLATWLNLNANESERELATQLEKFPGFVTIKHAVKKKDDKRTVLGRMEKDRRDWLPVVSDSDKLEGVVDRSRLVASMILEITKLLEASKSP
jgi:hypothetical protein